MEFTILDTARLRLRKITPEAFDFIYATQTDEELFAFLGISSAEDLAKEKENYNKGLATFNRTFLYFHIIEKASGKVIGWCGYHTWFPKHYRAEIGYGLYAEEYKQKGYMWEALQPVLTYGFEEMNLNRIEALIAEYNTPSFRLLQKSGFTKEGILRAHYVVDGIAEDSALYALLKSEWS